uniref:Ig-like domain-containing protein n=1 Tax=Erpetoichthys calabaricus TaxID=27687 RepID=A0A8C4X5N1_ERPCA
MSTVTFLTLALVLWTEGSSGDIVVTQSPAILSAIPGSTVTFSCKADAKIDDDMCLYHKALGQTYKALFIDSSRQSGVSDRFSVSGYDLDFTFKITNVQPEDAGFYYCMQSEATPLTQ